jgi:hypothetical protein
MPGCANRFTVRILVHDCEDNPVASGTIVRQSRKEDGRKAAAISSFFVSMYFLSGAQRRFPLQFDLIVINGGKDNIP